ncbi:hypothetical protein TCDM_13693 [Trypanosoma cruzi Dm28c]|uniref:Uncharacterized protein n=1 Tax=Trypanosoma cruzi Dm28c TaxID=1416333 RepID=V5A272_TRYCR|nr:hypothetical protein TCDM_13693 [Trypanosoma cruzi Dm28c]
MRSGRADTRSATHTATPCRRGFKIFCFACSFHALAVPSASLSLLMIFFLFAALTLPMERRDCRHVCALLSFPTHTHE